MAEMVSFIRRWWWGGDPDAPNPISGLTLRDIDNVRRSWNPIFADARANGYMMFTRMFEADPKTKTFFKAVANSSEEEMSRNIQFSAHLINIMTALNTYISNLDKPEMVIAWMMKIGETHRRRGIEKKHFMVFKDVLINILKNDLELKNDVIASWERYVVFMYQHILSELSI